MLSKCFKGAKASHSEVKPSITPNHVSYLGRYTQHTRTLYRKPGISPIKRENLLSWHITGVWKVFTLFCFLLKFNGFKIALEKVCVCVCLCAYACSCVCVYIHILPTPGRGRGGKKGRDSHYRKGLYLICAFIFFPSVENPQEIFPGGNYSLSSWKGCCQILHHPAFHCTGIKP